VKNKREKECALNQADVYIGAYSLQTEMRDKYKRGVLIVCRLFSSPESATVCLPEPKRKKREKRWRSAHQQFLANIICYHMCFTHTQNNPTRFALEE
jgi:hypothetical protein